MKVAERPSVGTYETKNSSLGKNGSKKFRLGSNGSKKLGVTGIKDSFVAWVLTGLLLLLGRAAKSEKNLSLFFGLVRRLGPNEYSRDITGTVQDKPWFLKIFRRMLLELSPHCRTKMMTNVLFGQFWEGSVRRTAVREKEGVRAPFTMIISPSMRCNLRCEGCYAGNYVKKDDLSIEVIDRVINEGKDLGIHLVTMLGGEPFIYDDLWDLWEKHDDIIFQVYTNGTLMDKSVARRLEQLGNVAVMVSIEGFEDFTDARRGAGAYRKIMQTMDNLSEVGVLHGFSATITSRNAETIISDEFNDLMISKGCVVGWYFQYMPMGRDPDTSLMPTPQQRLLLQQKGGIRLSERKPILLVDFWNHGPYVGGCLAGGRHYLHITSNGNVEPCVFTQFTVDNIKEKSLKEVLESPFFKGIRERQPYTENLLRPCMIKDHPYVLRELVEEFKPRPSYPGADDIIKNPRVMKDLDEYAKELQEVMDPVWDKEFGSDWKCWT